MYIKITLILLSTILIGLLLTPTSEATKVIPSSNNVVIPVTQTIEDDCVIAGNDVQVQGQVKGDVMAAGRMVTITGAVQGDVMVAGATVLLRGAVSDDVRAAGETVILSAPVGDNVTLAANSVTLDALARAGRDAIISASTIQVDGPIQRNLTLAGNDATLTSEVGGDVLAEVSHLSLGPTAIVRGDLTVVSENAPQIAPGAKVLGHVYQKQPTQGPTSWSSPTKPSTKNFGSWLMGLAMSFFGLLVLGALTLFLAPKGTSRLEATLGASFWGSLLAGLVALITVPIVAVLLMMTVIGIPAGLVLLFLYVVAIMEAGVTAACTVGRWLQRRLGRPEGSSYTRLLWGALALTLLTSLPWLGGVFGFLTLLSGLGALILEVGRPLKNHNAIVSNQL
jgi:hypothetical protein